MATVINKKWKDMKSGSLSDINTNALLCNTKEFIFPTGSRSINAGKVSGAYYSDRYRASSEQLLYAHNYGTSGFEEWVNFDRWYTVDLNKEEVSGRHYVFFCRPDLNLVESTGGGVKYKLNSKNGVGADQFFQYLGSYYPQVISSLCAEFANSSSLTNITGKMKAATASGYGNSSLEDGTRDAKGNPITIHSLLPYLTGRVESMQLPDYTIKNYGLVQPYTKYTIPYASSAIESQTGGTFDITFRDDKDFVIRKMFYAWVYYMDGVMRNRFYPKDKYMLYNCFDYATSIYDVMVDATGENIIWWSKYTGCFPLSVPISDLSFNRGSTPDTKCSIPWAYYHYEPLNAMALLDLNYNSLGYIYMNNYAKSNGMNPVVKTARIYEEASESSKYDATFLGRSFVGRPVIFMVPGERVLKLKWLLPPE